MVQSGQHDKDTSQAEMGNDVMGECQQHQEGKSSAWGEVNKKGQEGEWYGQVNMARKQVRPGWAMKLWMSVNRAAQ